MLKKRNLFALFLALMLALSVSCGDPDEEEDTAGGDDEETGEVVKAKYTSKGDEGSITGTIKFEGTPPVNPTLQMDADAYCNRSQDKSGETVVVKDGKVQNVIVYVKDGPVTKFSFDLPGQPATLDQQGCKYVPHVLTLMTKQDLNVTNSDDTTHNVHPLPKVNKEWNESQSKGQPILKQFSRQEVIPVKCNIHPWMKAYLGVFDHPFHTVSKADGTFEIKGLPPGQYTIEAWHEKMPAQTAKVTIGAKETKTQDFTFKAESALRSAEENGVKFGSTLVLPMLGGHH